MKFVLKYRIELELNDTKSRFFDFYDEIGLSEAEVGEHLGWDIDNGKGYIDLDFSTQLADDGTPCLVVGHNHPPIYLW